MGSQPSSTEQIEPNEEFNDLLRAAFEPPSEHSNSASVLARIEERTGRFPRVLLEDPSEESAPPIKPKSTEVGGRAGRYTVFGEIARGGVGVILKARDVDLGRDVAMKVILEKHRDHESMTDRFVEEAQVGGQLQHPGILPVYELGLLPDHRPYFTMKLIKGQTLGALLKERSRASENRQILVAAFEKVCEAMAYAHARGVVHRDLKPANIMVGSYGELKVIDWGFAKVLPRGGIADEAENEQTEHISEVSIIETVRSGSEGSQSVAGSVMGTPAYMSPEQAMGRIDRLDERSDVFSLGAILCEILTGAPPYTGTNEDIIVQALQANLAAAFDRLDSCGADKGLIAIAKSCLQAARGVRPANAGKLASEVHSYRMSVEDRARQAEVAVVEAKGRAEAEHVRAEANRRLAEEEGRRRRLGYVFASAIAAFAISVAAGGVWWHNKGAERLRQRSTELSAKLEHAREAIGIARAQTRPDLALWEKAVSAATTARSFADESEVNPELLASAQSAEQLARSSRDAATELDERIRRDQRMRKDLEELRFGSGDPFATDADDSTYSKLFRRYGINLETGEPDVLAKQVAASDIAAELSAAIDDWAFVRNRTERKGQRPALELARIAMLADANPQRNALRGAVIKRNVAKLEGFVGADQKAFNATAYHILGLGLGHAGAVKSAVKALEAGVARYPEDTRLQFDLAYWLTQLPQPRWDESAERYSVVLSRYPDSFAARNNMGAVLVETGQLERAIRLLSAVALEKDGYARGLLNVAVAKRRAGHADAEDWIDKAILADKKYALAHFHKASFLEEAEKRDEAYAAYKKAWELDRNLESACTKLVESRILFHDAETALKIAQTAIDRAPDAAWTWHLRGFVSGSLNDWKSAIEDIQKSIAMDESRAQAHADLGAAYFQLTDFVKAVAAYKRAVELDEDNARLRFDYASALEMQGKFDERIRQLEIAAGGKHPHAPSLSDLAQLRRRNGDVAGAIAQSKDAVRADPSDFVVCSLLVNTSCLVMSPEDALAEFDRFVAGMKKPNRAGALCGASGWFAARDDIPRAVQVLREAVRIAPLEVAPYTSLGSWAGWIHDATEIETIANELKAEDVHDRAVAAVLGSAAGSMRSRNAIEDSILVADLALQYHPNWVPLHHQLISSYMAADDSENALKQCEIAMDLMPNSTTTLYLWGWILGKIATDEDDPTAEYGKAGLPDNPYLRAYFLSGVARGMAAAGNWRPAVALMKKCVRTTDTWAPAYVHLSSCYADGEQLTEAIDALAKGVAISPGRANWVQTLARYLALIYEPDRARERYEELVGRPASAVGRTFDIGLASGYSARWRDTEAEKLLLRIELDPDQALYVANLRAIIALRAGDIGDAVRHTQKALSQAGTNAVLLATSGRLAYDRGDFDTAAQRYARAAYFLSAPNTLNLMRAKCALRLGDWAHAVELLSNSGSKRAVLLKKIAEEGRALGSRRAKLVARKMGPAGTPEEAHRWAGVAFFSGAHSVAVRYYRKAEFPSDPLARQASLQFAAVAALRAARSEEKQSRSDRYYADALSWLIEFVAFWESDSLQVRSIERRREARVALGQARIHPEFDWARHEEAITRYPKKQQDAWRKLRKRTLTLHSESNRFR